MTSKINKQIKKHQITVFAHRGLSAKYLENTLLAYQKAYKARADYIEIDVRLTKDNKMIIFHDDDIFRLTGKKKKIRKIKFDKLRSLDVGMGQKMPTLEEVFELCKNKIGVQIDVKDAGIIERILNVADEFDMSSQIFISSFNHKEIGKLKEIRPEIIGGIIVPSGESSKSPINQAIDLFINEAKEYSADCIHPNIKFATKNLIEKAHQEGLLINAWTIDRPDLWVRLIEMGVDGIFTNNCELLIEYLEHKDEENKEE
ncbi:MAG: glycerophosphodiester phosphodiesterase [Promethearchaeota archaeon]